MLTQGQGDFDATDFIGLGIELLPAILTILVVLRYLVSYRIHRKGSTDSSGRDGIYTWDILATATAVVVIVSVGFFDMSRLNQVLAIAQSAVAILHLARIWPRYRVVEPKNKTSV